MIVGYLLAVLFIICLTAGIFLFGYTARKAPTVIVTLLEVLASLLLISFLLLAQQQLSFSHLFSKPSAGNWLYLGLAAVTGVVGGNYFSLLNLKWGGEAINSLLSPAITAVVVLLSVWVTDTNLSWLQLIGIVLTLAGVSCFLWFGKKGSVSAMHRAKTFWTGAATVACISATILLSIKGGTVGGLTIFHTLWLRSLLALPVLLLLVMLQKNKRLPADASFYGVLLLAVALQSVVGSWLWFAASFRLGVPLFQTLVATLPFWVYAVEVYVLKRGKGSTAFVAAGLLALVSVGLLVWR